MQHEEECSVQFGEEARDCRHFLLYKFRKKLGFIIVCVLLFIVLLSIIIALYYGISLKEFSGLAIGLGIWLPSIVLGMVCVYAAITCMQRSTVTTSHFTSDGNRILNPHNNQESRLNMQAKYQPKIGRQSVEVPLQVRQGAAYRNWEDIPDEEPNQLERRRHFRSLSSSNLNRYKNKQNLNDRNLEECGYSLERIDSHGRYTSGNKLQREELKPRCRELNRSLSETGTLKYKHKKSGQYASHLNNLLNSPEVFNGRNYLSKDEFGKFYNRKAEESPRLRENSEKYLLTETGDFLGYNRDHIYPGGYMEGNGCYSNNVEQFRTDSPERITRFQQYSLKNPCMRNFNSSNVSYYPHEHNPVFHAFSPTHKMGYSRNRREEIDYSSRIRNKEISMYESKIPSNLQHNEKTFIPIERTFPCKENSAGFQFSNSRINAFKSLQDFADGGFLPNSNKVTEKVSPVTVNRSNFQIRPSVHEQSLKRVPYYNAQLPSMDCLLQRENNSQEIGYNMLKKRSPRERPKM